jgi:hypothetical protein
MSRNISGITERIHFDFTMLRSNMCFQFGMLNIYHPYNGCHSKGRAIMRRAALVHLESGYCIILAALILSNVFDSRHDPRRMGAATLTD